jgi:hypothetical protein
LAFSLRLEGPGTILSGFMLCFGGRSHHHPLATCIAHHGCFACQAGIRLGLIFSGLLVALSYSLIGSSAILGGLVLTVLPSFCGPSAIF